MLLFLQEKKLQDHILLNSVIEDLTEELSNTEEEGKQLEMNYQHEILQLTVQEKIHICILIISSIKHFKMDVV